VLGPKAPTHQTPKTPKEVKLGASNKLMSIVNKKKMGLVGWLQKFLIVL
jgi:hypothetical protein